MSTAWTPEMDGDDLYERAPIGYLSTSDDWRVLRVNATFAAMLGYEPEGIVGRPFEDLLAPGSRIYHETHYSPLVRIQGAVQEVSADLEHLDGRPVPVMMMSSRLVDTDSGRSIVRTCVMPASQRRAFEGELQAARQRSVAAERRLRILRGASDRLFGATTVKEIGQAIQEWTPQPVRHANLWLIDAAGGVTPAVAGPNSMDGRASGVESVQLALQAPVARIDPDRVASVVIRWDGEVVGVLILDLAEHASHAEWLDSGFLQSLGGTIAQALARARLIEAKDWLLGVAAHDLRTPLATIQGLAETLQITAAEALSERDVDMLGRIRSTTLRMATLIDSVLSYSTIEAGKLALVLEPGDLRSLVAEVVHDFEAQARAKSVSLHLDDQPLRSVEFDAAKIRQVVDNLVSNAIKYTNAGGSVVVRVALDEGFAVVEVTDDGLGIPADEIDQVFRPFQRLTPRPTGGEASNGLGLSIAHAIVTGHGGRLTVSSEAGRGSSFTLSLRALPSGSRASQPAT